MKTRFRVVCLSALLSATSLPLAAQSYNWTVLAGQLPQIGSLDGELRQARFFAPNGIASDAAGNLYVSDTSNHTVRKISATGIVTTLAGRGGVPGSVDGTAWDARFFGPHGLAVDAMGNVYVADRGNHVIRRISPTGVVTRFAGQPGQSGFTDGPGLTARFNNPYGLAFDSAGNLCVSDRSNHVIRRISPAGVVTTFAGTAGAPGFADASGAAARFAFPSGIASDAAGNLYVSDSANHTVRKITPDGTVSTVAGTPGVSGVTNGTGSAARFNSPAGLAVEASGNIYVADGSNDCLRRIAPDGVVTAFAGGPDLRGSTDAPGTAARFFSPLGVTLAPNGQLYVADTLNHSIRQVTPDAEVTTFAGPGGTFGSADGTGSAAQFNYAHHIVLDDAGDILVADTRNVAIRRVTPAGEATRVIGTPGPPAYIDGDVNAARFVSPFGIALGPNGLVAVSEPTAHTLRVIQPTPRLLTLAGAGGQSGSTDGPANTARFNAPHGIAVDRTFNVYVADTNNHTIRKIEGSTGMVTTLAGVAGQSGSADGAGAAARFNRPRGIAVDPSGTIYVADTSNHTIRRITADGVVTTFAGTAGLNGSADGTGIGARFAGPAGVALDRGGNVFVADTSNHAVRKITAAGVVTTLGGLPGVSGASEGSERTARFFSPTGIAVNSAGTIYVMARDNNVLMVGIPERAPVIAAHPQALTVAAGASATLAVSATGSGLQYQWRRDGAIIPGATGRTYTLTNASAAAAGSYSVDVINSAAVVPSVAARVAVSDTTDVGRITNLAIRSQAGTGAQTLTVGVSIGGARTAGSKPVLIRGIGPALGAFGVPGVLVDPKLELYTGTNRISDNDNWAGSGRIASLAAQVGAFPLTDNASKDAALDAALTLGGYSVQIVGVGGATGVALAEIYDATPPASYGASTPRLTNVSARTQVGTGGDVLIAGFVIGGHTSKTVLIRAVGPTLATFLVPDVLLDPKLELFSSTGKIDENDNWGGAAAAVTASNSVGAFALPPSSRDAALLVTLPPGNYTAQVSGVSDSIGVALVEIYEVP